MISYKCNVCVYTYYSIKHKTRIELCDFETSQKHFLTFINCLSIRRSLHFGQRLNGNSVLFLEGKEVLELFIPKFTEFYVELRY